VPRPLEDAGNLTYLIDAARHLAGRVASEVVEELDRPAAQPAH
jgi:ribosomal protein L13